MTEGTDFVIRKYNRCDRQDVRRISCETAFLGEPGKVFFDDDEILADSLTLYFTDYEPDSCFVALEHDKVAGYIIGAKDTRAMNRVVLFRVIPLILAKSIRKGIFLDKNTRRFLIQLIVSFLKGEFFFPDFSRQYPATLHINIDKHARGSGVGTGLIERYLQFLKTQAVTGVYLGTVSEGARIFFSKMGFTLLFMKKRSYLRYYLNRDINFYILAKSI